MSVPAMSSFEFPSVGLTMPPAAITKGLGDLTAGGWQTVVVIQEGGAAACQAGECH